MIKLLGAGGMGCVFLAQDKLKKRQAAIKCFWEKREGTHDDVFEEAMMMDKIAGEYVPEPLDCGYANAILQEKPYFVTEYLDGALDGESWLEKPGKLDVSTGLDVGIHIAKGLQIAHEHKIFHMDLKPANLLLKRTKTGLMVKIIDFGLARVGVSLRDNAQSRRNASGMTAFGQGIVGTLYYAPPEQMGETQYGKPGAKSDLYAFGATLYRLMSGEKSNNLNPHYLADAPSELFDLLCECKKNDPAERPASALHLVKRLEKIKARRGKSSVFRQKVFVGIAVIVVGALTWFNFVNNIRFSNVEHETRMPQPNVEESAPVPQTVPSSMAESSILPETSTNSTPPEPAVEQFDNPVSNVASPEHGDPSSTPAARATPQTNSRLGQSLADLKSEHNNNYAAALNYIIKNPSADGHSKLKALMTKISTGDGLDGTSHTVTGSQKARFAKYVRQSSSSWDVFIVRIGLFEYIAAIKCKNSDCGNQEIKIDLELSDITKAVSTALNQSLPQSARFVAVPPTRRNNKKFNEFMAAVVLAHIM